MKHIYLKLIFALSFSVIFPSEITVTHTSFSEQTKRHFIKLSQELNTKKAKRIAVTIAKATTLMLAGGAIAYIIMRRTGINSENNKNTIVQNTPPISISTNIPNPPFQPTSTIAVNKPKISPEKQKYLNNQFLYWCAPRANEEPDQQIPKLKELIAKGAQIDAKHETGATPLITAASLAKTNIVQFLLANGANTKATDDDGETALDNAKRCIKVDFERFSPVVKILEAAQKQSPLS